MLQWTAPWMLAGATLMALPLIAHWLNRYSRRVQVFPTLQFLLAAAAAENRWLKLRRLLLLLLRCLVVLLLVAAFAQPVWFGTAPSVQPDRKVCLALVIDNSVSTTQIADGVAAQGRIRAAGKEVLDSLVVGRDEALVVVADAQPRPLFRRMSPNIPELKSSLAAITATQSRADLEAAVQVAASQLAEQPNAVQKVLVVISDLQQTNWQQANRPLGQGLALPPGCELRIVDLKLKPVGNVALSRPQSLPRDPLPGQTIQVGARITNFGTQTQQVPVTLLIEGREIQTQTVQVESQQGVQASFSYVFSPEQGRKIEFRIPPDALLADNRAFLYLQPGKQIPVGLLSNDRINQHGSSTYFLERALRPFANDADRFDVQLLVPSQVTMQSLSRLQVLVVGYIREWQDDEVKAIINFVANGGRLLYFCGEGRVGESLEQIERLAGQPFFPFQVGRRERWQQAEQMPNIESGQWRGRWLREFDLASQFALQQIRFPAVWSVPNIQSDSEVLLYFSQQRPGLALRSYGTGLVLQANFSPSIEAGDFGKYAAFAALVQILTRQLLEESDSDPTSLVGQPLLFGPVTGLNASSKIQVQIPNETMQAADLPTVDSAATGHVVFSEVAEPGFYTLSVEDKPFEVQAVNLDPRESDLRSLEAATAAAAFPTNTRGSSSGNNSVVTTAQPIVDQGQSLWGWLLIIGMIALSVESFLLGYWRR